MDALLDCSDLGRDHQVLAGKDVEAKPRDRRNTIIFGVGNDFQQFGPAIAALGRDDAQLGHMSADCIRHSCVDGPAIAGFDVTSSLSVAL